MATISEITSGSSYTGNKELGGYLPSAIDIDNKPVQTLAAYTVMYNKSLFDQRQKDADEKIKRIGELTALDISDAMGKDKQVALDAMSDLMKYSREYAMKGTPTNPKEKIEQELELKERTKSAVAKISSINARGVAYKLRLNAINAENTTASVKAEKKRQLQEEFDNTNWDTPLSSEAKYDIQFPKIGEPLYTKNTTSINTGNAIVQQEVQIFNQKKNLDASFGEANDVFPAELPKNATEEQKKEFALKQAMGGSQKTWNDAALFLNQALSDPKYKDANGNINVDAIVSDNPIAGNILKLVERSNKYAQEGLADVAKGYYVTRLGHRVDLNKVITKDDFVIIDPSKGLSPAQIIYLQKFADAKPDQKDEKIIFTGENIKQAELEIARKNAETARLNANKKGTTASGDAGSDLAAKTFEGHIVRLKDYFDSHKGKVLTLSADRIDPVTKKALGIDSDNTIVTYRRDGSIRIGTDKEGRGGTPMTLDQFKFNIITAIKGGSKDEAQLDAKFVEQQEAGFNDVFGTTDSKAIWESVGTKVNKSTSTTTQGAATAPIESLREKYGY